MNNEKKVFAFKLAEKKQQEKASPNKWKAREGVSLAGCSDFHGDGNPREDDWLWGRDAGVWC